MNSWCQDSVRIVFEAEVCASHFYLDSFPLAVSKPNQTTLPRLFLSLKARGCPWIVNSRAPEPSVFHCTLFSTAAVVYCKHPPKFSRDNASARIFTIVTDSVVRLCVLNVTYAAQSDPAAVVVVMQQIQATLAPLLVMYQLCKIHNSHVRDSPPAGFIFENVNQSHDDHLSGAGGSN